MQWAQWTQHGAFYQAWDICLIGFPGNGNSILEGQASWCALLLAEFGSQPLL